MNRAKFIGAILGLLGVKAEAQDWAKDLGCKPNLGVVWEGATVRCRTEGEEYCPLGHSNKPTLMKPQPMDLEQYMRDQQLLMRYQGRWTEPRICSICSVIYAKTGATGW